MLRLLHLVAFLLLLINPSLADPLADVLQDNGFTEFAQLLEQNPPSFDVNAAGSNLIVYVPTNPALRDANFSIGGGGGGGGGSGPVTRRADEAAKEKRATDLYFADQNTVVLRKKRETFSCSAGAVYQTRLDDPDLVNLGPGRNQTLVEKDLALTALHVVFSGLGASAKVTAADIPFDGGVIRPLSEDLTLPQSLSTTLPYLHASAFLSALGAAGDLLAEIERTPAVTVLAPTDAVFNTAAGGASVSEAVLRDHILVRDGGGGGGPGFPAYTPLLQDGATYRTLGGRAVTVSLADGVARIGGAVLLAGDALVENGVVHTIGGFVQPGGSLTTDPPTGSPTASGGSGGTSSIATAGAVAGMVPAAWGAVAAGLAGVAVPFGVGLW